MTTPLTPETHANSYWQRFTNYQFTANSHTAPLVAAELSVAVQAFAMAFIRINGHYDIVAILSPTPAENYYINSQGQWLGGYVPSCFRGYPFSLDSSGQLCIDEESGLIHATEGEALFDSAGQLTPQVAAVRDFLQKIQQNKTITDLSIAALVDAGLIKEWPLTLKINGVDVVTSGLYRIDDAKLNTLDDAAFLKLRTTQSLPVAYAQLFSMGNISHFEKLAKLRQQTAKPAVPDLDKLFGESDILKF